MTTDPMPSRRGLLAMAPNIAVASALGGAMFSLAAGQDALGQSSPRAGGGQGKPGAQKIDLSKPADNLRALQKMLGSTDPRQDIFFYGSGRVYGCVNERPPVPLFGTHSVVMCRTKAGPDGTFLLRQQIVGFRTVFDTEEVMDSMINPINGATLTLPRTNYGVSENAYGLDGTLAMAAKPPRMQFKGAVRPWTVGGGVVSLADDVSVTPPGPESPDMDIVTRSAFVSEILDPTIKSANSWFSFTATHPFRPWLKMTDPGHELWHLDGRKVHSPSEIPQFMQDEVAKRWPALFQLAHF